MDSGGLEASQHAGTTQEGGPGKHNKPQPQPKPRLPFKLPPKPLHKRIPISVPNLGWQWVIVPPRTKSLMVSIGPCRSSAAEVRLIHKRDDNVPRPGLALTSCARKADRLLMFRRGESIPYPEWWMGNRISSQQSTVPTARTRTCLDHEREKECDEQMNRNDSTKLSSRHGTRVPRYHYYESFMSGARDNSAGRKRILGKTDPPHHPTGEIPGNGYGRTTNNEVGDSGTEQACGNSCWSKMAIQHPNHRGARAERRYQAIIGALHYAVEDCGKVASVHSRNCCRSMIQLGTVRACRHDSLCEPCCDGATSWASAANISHIAAIAPAYHDWTCTGAEWSGVDQHMGWYAAAHKKNAQSAKVIILHAWDCVGNKSRTQRWRDRAGKINQIHETQRRKCSPTEQHSALGRLGLQKTEKGCRSPKNGMAIQGWWRGWRWRMMWSWVWPLQGSQWGPLLPMIRAIQHNRTRSYEWTMEALETGVDRTPDLVHLPKLPGENERFGISHPAYGMRKQMTDWIILSMEISHAMD